MESLLPTQPSTFNPQHALWLRVKDLDLERRQIVVRDGKGAKDRMTMVPEKLVAALGEHLVAVRQQHESDLAAGYAGVWLPDALARKYSHGAGAFGARERGNDANLHARHAEAGDWGALAVGWVGKTFNFQRSTLNFRRSVSDFQPVES